MTSDRSPCPRRALPWLLLGLVLGGLVAAAALAPRAVVATTPLPDFAEIVAQLEPGLVHVTTRLEGDRAPASRDDAVGAGFVLRPDGWILTSRHVLNAARQVYVTVPGRGTFEATVAGQDEATDIAVLRIAAQGLAPLPIGEPRALRKGQWVLAAGSPFHLPFSWSVGIVSGLGRSQVGVNPKGYEDFIQTDAAANVGSSGGPLVDASGRVVGVMTAILSRTGRSEGVSLATPIDVVLDAVRRIEQGEAPRRPSLGVVVRERDTRGSGRPGLEITRFEADSAGRDAGLLAGDVITAIDGTPTAIVGDLQRALWSRGAGATVRVTILRQGRPFEVTVRPR